MPQSPGTQVGVYVWGGLLQQGEGLERFHASLRFLLDRGFKTLRFTISANSLNELGVKQTACGQPAKIGCYLGHVLDNPIFDDSRLSILMLTLHENAAREVLSGGMTEQRRQAVAAELRHALDVLHQRFAQRPIRLILSNWEGDNLVYCGGVFQYSRSAEKARACDTEDGHGVDRRLANFVTWIQLRDRVVNEFRAVHPGFNIAHAPEFNIAHLDPARCVGRCDRGKTVFEALARQGKRPLCSYSSYSSTNRNTLKEDLPRLLQSCEQVILGEIGFAEARQGSDKVRQGFARVAEAVAAYPGKVPAMIVWNAFNQPGATREDSFGLFRDDGTPGNIRNMPPSIRLVP
ncbi:hypothetical protein [Teichococcus oryzae]|uniref:Uncharacterized protein n=1 Tax=Teichococcus oryzae TaxID=1608942 RepID=A0A5B2T9Y1_9PROT|nr:hypothetical protein [Pseudoroseomonas oryzae]KAA2211406.1 hypothetical protein F0Q34_20265 [Pseudoroseomonas oryzae]